MCDWEVLASTSAREWAGRARYAAAMSLYQKGEIPADVLEVYRICSRLDAEDALTLLALRGIGAKAAERVRRLRGQHAEPRLSP